MKRWMLSMGMACLLVGLPAQAQEGPPPGAPPAGEVGPMNGAPQQGPRGKAGHEGRQRRQKAMERIHTLRVQQLSEILNMDEESSARFFEGLTEYDQSLHALHERRRDAHRKMARSLEGGGEGRSPEAMAGLTHRLMESEQAEVALTTAFVDQIDDYLSPAQVGRFLLYQKEFERHLKGLIHTMRPGSPPEARESALNALQGTGEWLKPGAAPRRGPRGGGPPPPM